MSAECLYTACIQHSLLPPCACLKRNQINRSNDCFTSHSCTFVCTGKKKGKAEKKELRKARRAEAAADSSAGTKRLPPTVEELLRVGAHIDSR